MNSYRLNGIAGHQFRRAVCKKLEISHTQIYKEVKSISNEGVITVKDGRKFTLSLVEIKEEENGITRD